jgi:hypothetical protein
MRIWLPIAAISPFHLVRLFFLGIKLLFVVGDKVVRIEHSRVKSKALMWRVGRNVDG